MEELQVPTELVIAELRGELESANYQRILQKALISQQSTELMRLKTQLDELSERSAGAEEQGSSEAPQAR